MTQLEEFDMNIRVILRRARRSLEMSQKRLAEKMGFNNREIITEIERCNRKIELCEFIKLCSFLSLLPSAVMRDAAAHTSKREIFI